MNIIYTRSPYHITINGSAGDEAEVEIYVWDAVSSQPATPTYTLDKVIVNSANQAYFNVSPFIKESIRHTQYFAAGSIGNLFTFEYANVFIQPKLNGVNLLSSTHIATDGYLDYNGGARNNVFLTEGTYYYDTVGDKGNIHIYDDSTTSTEIKYTGLQTGSVQTLTMTAQAQKATTVHSTMINEGNKVEVIEDGSEIATYYFVPMCEPQYTVHQCDFINKHGMWQRLSFFKASKTTLNCRG